YALLLLELAECQRLLGRYVEAANAAAALDREGVATETRLAARAELLRVAIAQSDFVGAQRLMDGGGSVTEPSAADFDLARLEALLAFSRAAGEGKRISINDVARPQEMAKVYQQQAAEQAEKFEKAHGPYWGRRASQLLITALPRSA